MATTLPESPPPDDRRLELVVGVALVELLVVDDEVSLDVLAGEVLLDVEVSLGSEVVEAVVREVLVELGGLGVVGGAVVLGGAAVRLTGVSDSGVLVDGAELLPAPEPVSPGTVTGARVTVGTPPAVVPVPVPEVTAGDGADEVTAFPQAASSSTVMP
ncbi:hypothetical protein ABIB25_002898 [Nakamurella sp. UYEF19]|uniref:hypothetical protein n=1 Tax=Nakamurella sp. UYEF19 TaxID=1756392 RepID=UPI003392F5E9